ncbi:MAG: histone deacetylase [Bacteroidota bacterium]|nr:histone deacetylase [Bacteroidota bacterium]
MPTKSKTGFVYHDQFLLHHTGIGHPEKPERLKAIVSHLQTTGLWNNLQHLFIDSAPTETIRLVHSSQHIKFVKDRCDQIGESGTGFLDQGDTTVSSNSYDVALLAAGGVIAAVDAVCSGVLTNAFCAIRPPGHHAETNTPMGFCLFNNVAIAARYAQNKFNVRNVAIIDWDVHHGNGTQEIFYNDPSVFYISTHQYPFYPGTGARSERGSGKGEGFTLNCPMKAGSSEADYLQTFKNEIVPVLNTYRPELILISAGFDAHLDDPLANINLTENSFGIFTEILSEAAAKYSDKKIVSILEGGYNLNALSKSVQKHLEILMKP